MSEKKISLKLTKEEFELLQTAVCFQKFIHEEQGDLVGAKQFSNLFRKLFLLNRH